MASDRVNRRCGSANIVALPENEQRRVSLTGYSNIVIDDSSKRGNEDDQEKLRVRFASLPSVGLGLSGTGPDEQYKRKYSVALQVLKPFRPSSKDGKLPINKVGFFSYVFVTWLSPLVWKMFKHRSEPIAESDIWQCSDAEGVRENTERILRIWREEVKKRGMTKASFDRVWRKFIQTRVYVGLSIMTLMAMATFLSSAFLLELVISYLESDVTSLGYGLGLTAGVLACEVTRACSFANLMIFGAQTGTRVRAGFMGIMYDKLLRMRTIKGNINSEIINVFSVDSYRVYMASFTVTFLLSVPIYLVIGTVYCYFLIGPWCFVSIGTFIICYETQTLLARVLQKLRKYCTQFTDKRVRRMGEILNSMKFIKMYAWEQPFTDAIKGVRHSEQKYLLYSALVNAITGSIIPITPTIASVITISIYTAAGNSLSASTAFAVIGTMNFLRMIVALIPLAMRCYGEAKVSFSRIEKLLMQDEYVQPSSDCEDKRNAIEIENAGFMWDSEELKNSLNEKDKKDAKLKRKYSNVSLSQSRRESFNLFALTDMNLRIEKGNLVGICGTVGCGKSSLLSAIFGRMQMTTGRLAVDGSVAYVPQQAWIFNDSLKNNILFGKDYRSQRYLQVISACGLEPDLEILSDGDETEIGERGANLSGGQKQRVNLARAVYSDSDIFFLDDPLSAVDVRVGKQIFHTCIKSLLKDKTVLLVTHQLQYLKHCDEVIVVEDGRIVEHGTHSELLAGGGIYSEMFRIFDETSMKPVTKQNGTGKLLGDADQGASDIKQEAQKSVELKGILSNGKSRTIKKRRGKLILSEEASIGDISFETYSSYIRAAGGWFVAFLVILMYFIAAGSLVFSDWWLSEWLNTLTTQPVNSSDMSQVLNPFVGSDFSTDASLIAMGKMNSTYDSTSTLWMNSVSQDTYFLVYIVSLAGIILLQLVKSFVGAKASINASNKIHASAVDKVMKAPMSFFDSNPVGRTLNRFSKDLDEGDVFIPQITNSLLRILTIVIVSTIMSAIITPWILIAVVPVVIVFYLMKTISNVSVRQLKRLENIARSPLLSHVNATSQGLSTIVTYGQQGRFFETCIGFGDVAAVTIFLFDVSMWWIGLRLDLMAGMMTVGTTLVLVLTKGLIPPASGGLILGLCGKTVSIVQFLVRLMNEAEGRFTSVERLHEYEELVTEPQHAHKMAPPEWPNQGGVVFRDVVMRYRPDMNPVLRNVSFEIRPREKVGVIGRTGAGKSSLAAALFRLVELSSGHIYIDGEDISQLHLNVIRSKVSTIPQDPVLFAGTMRYNIDPFSQYSDDEIWNALEKVHMKEKVVAAEEGLEMAIEENGENFSVGERQLICLSRAVLRSSKILLLDEATANIDTSTDAMIQETIRNCFSECTVITIAHRLNTVLHSDKIIVMDLGRVMECASPQDLLSNPQSFFNAMIASQTVKTPSP